MCSTGECFVVLPSHSSEHVMLIGRNSVNDDTLGEAQEVIYYDASTASEGKCDGGTEPEVIGSLRVILQKPLPGIWGGDYGANEKNVCIGITYVANEPEPGSGHLLATDIVRYTLAAAKSAADAVEQIGSLVTAYGKDVSKSNYVVCDAAEAWLVSCYGKLWAAYRCHFPGFKYISCQGLSVADSYDKSSDNLGQALISLGLWDGEKGSRFVFNACCGAYQPESSEYMWSGDYPSKDRTYSLTNMFEKLRASAKNNSARSATVSVINSSGISCHWFTATPNPSESVFKPFVFAPSPKISPLTKVPVDEKITLLHKLHAQRKATAVEDLKCLEASCVEEVNNYFAEHPSPNEELDELMKDCVEAEVKFYR